MKLRAAIFTSLVIIGITTQTHAGPKVTQGALVNFGVNQFTTLAVEELGKPPSLLILDREDIVYSTEFTKNLSALEEFAYTNSFLRFRTFNIKGLPALLLAIAAQPTGTDQIFDVKIISGQKGKIALLNPDVISLTIQDGIFLGFINSKYGYGMVTWNFQWDAAHYAPHKYEIHIYNFDQNREAFISKTKIMTKKKFKDGCSALKYYGLPCKNFRDDVIKVGEDIGTLGAEGLLVQSGTSEK